MQLAEMTEDVLRTDLDGAGSSGMQPAGTAGHDLQRLHRRPGGGQYREGIGLGIERVGSRRARPVPAEASRGGEAAAKAGGRNELLLGPVAFEDLPDFEQRRIG